MDIAEIKEYLPHRYPFLLVDRVLELEPDKRIVALKNVTINEPFFDGHFPHYPVMPGVLIVEAMAQAAALLSFKSLGTKRDDNTVVYLVGVDGARFKRPIVPGDTLILEAEKLMDRRGLIKYAVRAKVGDQVACEATLLCTQRTITKP
ncbi:MAG: 3-hydroxyacyl-ACP dehydratase FabZ [Burkholderiales bacterium]|nr:3-hydroxyacyl-ACP dehydratase FabZ [Burkholderiales bacterium]